jgi:hypothetical protein
MTDVTSRPKVDVVPSRQIGVVILAALLSVGARQLPSIASDGREPTVPASARAARTPRGAAYADRVAQADGVYEPTRDSWFRIGDLVHDVTRKLRQDHLDPTRDAVEPQAEHVRAPLEMELPSQSPRDSGR